jgi:hypothetical protein
MNSKGQMEIAQLIVNEFSNVITGSQKKDVYFMDDKSFIMTGVLGAIEEEGNLGGDEVIKKKGFRSIPSVANSIIVPKSSHSRIYIKLKGYLFYRVLLSYEQILDYSIKKYQSILNTDTKSIAEIIEDGQKKGIDLNYSYPLVYNRLSIESILEDVVINIEDFQNQYRSVWDEPINISLKRYFKEEINDCYYLKPLKYSPKDLVSESSYENIIKPKELAYAFPWMIGLDIKISEHDNDHWRVYITFTNKSRKIDTMVTSFDPQIYNAQIEISADDPKVFCDFPLEYLKKSYKKKPVVKSIPNNAASEFDGTSIKTNNLPFHIQYRLVPKDIYSNETSFSALIDKPIENLEKVLTGMEEDYKKAQGNYLLYITTSQNSDLNLLFERDLKDYRQEINRFKYGIEILKRKDHVMRSFKLMNKTFEFTTNPQQKTYSGWRLFQIVFIVSQIPDIVFSEYSSENDPILKFSDPSISDLLYFPTGGGKTEAFFGCVVFTMFFDRFREKNYGLSAIVKYPLRLLSAQQLERALNIVVKANEVKKSEGLINSKPDFTLGYFVGEGNTANDIKIEMLENIRNSRVEDLEDQYRVIDTCPYCSKKSISVRMNEQEWIMEHFCTNNECKCDVLPLYTVDSEIYRRLPTIVVSTIDKLANIGLNSNFKNLFGGPKYYCESHGFLTNDKCYTPFCQSALISSETLLKDPIPTLVIQDELHLVRESLGVFASHYETFLQYYCEKLVSKRYRKKLKYIGATATIVNYEDHILNLYGTVSRRFPCQYPNRLDDEDFYSYIDKSDLNRIILGFSPQGYSVTESIMETNVIFRSILYRMLNNLNVYAKKLEDFGVKITTDELQKHLHNYWISINYTNSKDDSVELYNLYQNQGNNRLNERGIPGFLIAQMIGDSEFQDIRKIMSAIYETSDVKQAPNMILATSTISHGVDEDKFNQMYFFGVPNNTAEYIQAYSRVGRKFPGIVIDIIRLMRERDKSYLKNFGIFHENKDLLIDPVPINRWAKNAVYLTLPGIMAAVLKQYFEPNFNVGSLHFAKNIKRLLNEELISIDQVTRILVDSYKCDESIPQSQFYKEIITNESISILSSIRNDATIGEKTTIFDVLEKFSAKNSGPMRSLRDVEKGLLVRVD